MRENQSFISIVVPTCNRTETLMNCIDSIRANNYRNFEIIVVDQGFDDETQREIEKRFHDDRRIVYLRSNIRCSSDSRNKGWHEARGEIIAFTDDDAFVGSGWLEAYEEAFRCNHPRVVMAAGRIVPVFKIPKPSWLPPEKEYLLPSFDAGDEMRPFPQQSLPISANLAITRALLEQTGGFDTRLGLKMDGDIPYITGEDSFLGMKVRKSGGFILYQPRAVVYHPVTAQRLTRRFFLKRNFREGATTIAVENVQTLCTEERLSAHVNWHLKKIMFYALLFCKDFITPRKDRMKASMRRASEIAFSIGVIHHSIYLKKNLKTERSPNHAHRS
jgi:glycosyltransferase involved in cell wall biosynthesis